jgi:hypothetical protein
MSVAWPAAPYFSFFFLPRVLLRYVAHTFRERRERNFPLLYTFANK